VSQTLGSNGKVRWNHPKDGRLDPKRFDEDIHRVLELIVEMRRAWEQAVDGGSFSPRTGNGRPSSFEETDPTYAAAVSPTQRQSREAAKRATSLLGSARQRLEDAVDLLEKARIRQDPDVLEEFLEKRRAATQ
jgi:hypothetical protein